MPLQMTFTDVRGVSYPASYWVLHSVQISPLTNAATVVFSGFADSMKIKMQPVGGKSYSVTAAKYASIFGAAALTQAEITAALYTLAQADPFFKTATLVA